MHIIMLLCHLSSYFPPLSLYCPPSLYSLSPLFSPLSLLQVANRLKIIGDQIDARLKSEVDMALKDLYASQSIWEVGYSQFRGTLQGVFSRCHVCDYLFLSFFIIPIIFFPLECSENWLGTSQCSVHSY